MVGTEFFEGVVLVVTALGLRDAIKLYIDRRWPKKVTVRCGTDGCLAVPKKVAKKI